MRPDTLLEVVRKELGVFFSSPIGYLFLAAYLGVTLFSFFWGEAFFARNISDVRPMFEWFPILLIFLAAALTMRIWSDERRTGTIEFIVTLPATSMELVVGKFLACLVLLVIALVVTLPLPILVSYLGDLDIGPVCAGYVATILLGCAYLSIGLFVSARTDNQFVSLVLTVFLCGVFYLLGSAFLTNLFSNDIAAILRELGAGSRFESITRGVLDLPDLYFYVSVALTFLALNVYSLKSYGWAADGNKRHHRLTVFTTLAVCANVLVANVWMHSMSFLRWDVTEGDQYSISEVTRQALSQLNEPLLIRGYFSAKTHPLLAPLVPQLQDLLREFEVVGGSHVRVEIVDPVEDAELEDEANSVYGIRPVPFQVSDRHESSLVQSYFDILLKYGDEYEVLGFRDLIEVKLVSETELDVKLRNPEFDITRSVKKIFAEFQGGGSTFDYISNPIRFVGYISDDAKLPDELASARGELRNALSEIESDSDEKFSWEIVDPEAGDGETARFIQENYGFQPQVASLFARNAFYFYLTLTDGQAVISVSLPVDLDTDGFKLHLGEGLKRFAEGLLKGVEMYVPPPPRPSGPHGHAHQPVSGPQFTELRKYLSSEYEVQSANLANGVGASADVLLVLAPSALTSSEVFAIDQFLMRGGTVVVAGGAYRTQLTQRSLAANLASSGLDEWLQHNGVTVESSMVLDRQNAAFPLPTTRTVGSITFQEMRMFDYPYFLDVRGNGIASDHPANRDLAQLTFAWASPLTIDESRTANLGVIELYRSSDSSWTAEHPDVMPRITETSASPWSSPPELSSHLLGVVLSGRFSSFFEESPLIEAARAEAALEEERHEEEEELSEEGGFEEVELEEDKLGVVSGVISQSPESARLIVLGSSDFIADQTLQLLSSVGGSLYTNSIQSVTNIVSWAVEDASLLSIRGRGHFNRTLIPLEDDEQRLLEYIIYGSVLVLLALIFGINWQIRSAQKSSHARMLGVES